MLLSSPSCTRASGPLARCWLFACAAVLFVFGGCASVDDTLAINDDGSWTVTIESRSPANRMQRQQATMMLSMGSDEQGITVYPPLTEAEARALFQDSAITVTSEALSVDGGGGGMGLKVTAQGASLDSLLDSPYAALRELHLALVDDHLVVAYRDPMRRGIPLFMMSEEDAVAEDDDSQYSWLLQNLGGLISARTAWRSTQRLHLPAIHQGDALASVVDGIATWDVDPEQVADSAVAQEHLLALRQVQAAPLTVAIPERPLPLGLYSFADLPIGPIGGQAQAVDEERIRSEARWLPLTLQVARSFNYTGERQHGRDGSRLSMLLLLPQDLRPLSWGEIDLQEAADSNGNSLITRNRMWGGTHYSWSGRERGPLSEVAWNRYQVNFGHPPRGEEHIAKVSVAATLLYPGAPHAVKGEGLVNADDISDKDGGHRSWNHNDQIPIAGLGDHGLTMRHLHVARHRLGYDVQMHFDGASSRIAQVQVYDANGTPWPTLSNPMMRSSDHIIVLGHPQPPLSLALVVDGGGAQITLNHTFTDLPLLAPADDESDEE